MHGSPLVFTHTSAVWLQSAAVRFLTGSHKGEHISPALAPLHWLPVSFRVHFKALLLVFKEFHGQAPSYQSDLLIPYTAPKTLRSSEQKLRGGYAFSAVGLWSKLPHHIRSEPSTERLEAHLLSLAFQCTLITTTWNWLL